MASTQFSSIRAAPVQSVQELIKEPIPAVPQPFILDDPQPPILSASTPLPQLPTIDMKHLIMSETAGSELEKLHSTCKEWGFFQLVNHGVSSSLMEKLKSEIGEFYKLPLEERMKYKMRPGDVEGTGFLQSGQKIKSLTGVIGSLCELQKLAMMLLGFMAKALKLEKGEMEELFDDGMQSVRMTYYPPCPQPELLWGLRLTLMLPASPSFSKLMEWMILSNGVYTSIEHRATVNAAKERISIAMFFNPKSSAQIKPAASLINPQNPPLFKQVGMEKYFKDFFSRKLDGKSYLEHMKIKNEEA
ncbi:Protein SRG1 [Vitis vinifera]|uniref:Protein SRG1 n=1 Tax=Vitis vinifera TaxID=29760 RepID=A0A438JNV8_VITVI|nr:Protein SRG1 [Vitis vinifera]